MGKKKGKRSQCTREGEETPPCAQSLPSVSHWTQKRFVFPLPWAEIRVFAKLQEFLGNAHCTAPLN